MWLEFVGFVLLGMVFGTLGGFFGIGGGLIAIPMLAMLFGMEQHLAQGTALVMVVPNVLMAVWRYNQINRIEWGKALTLAGGGLLFGALGAWVAAGLPEREMRLGFSCFMAAIALYTFYRLWRPLGSGVRQTLPSHAAMGGLGVVSGLAGGVFAIGSAVVATPVLTGFFGLSQVIAQGLSLVMALPVTSITLAVFASHNQVDWLMGAALALGGVVSIGWGVKYAHRLPDRLLKICFAVFLLLCSVGLVLR